MFSQYSGVQARREWIWRGSSLSENASPANTHIKPPVLHAPAHASSQWQCTSMHSSSTNGTFTAVEAAGIHCGGGSRSAHRAAAARQVLSGGMAVFLRKRVSSWLNFFSRKHNSLGRERFECISVNLLDLETGEAPVNKDWITMTTTENTT